MFTKTDNCGENEVCVVGAGLAGTMIAALLAKAGFIVSVYEKRPDPRADVEGDPVISSSSSAFGSSTSATKRSINLALSHRGMCALKEVGLLDSIMQHAIRMPCRVIHNQKNGNGNVVKQAYGKKDEAIWSVGRQTINMMLLELLESDAFRNQVTVSFNHGLVKADSDGNCTFSNTSTPLSPSLISRKFSLVIGADGAYSSLRDTMLKQGRLNFSRSYVAHGYKELTIPPTLHGDYALADFEGLHIWPRGEMMLIALPNPDKSFTVTLFAPYHGKDGFDAIDPNDDFRIKEYFQHHFPDVVDLMPNLTTDYRNNPVGALVTVRVKPWNLGKLVLLGDAAHAVVPFYGQGMNAAFEDGLIFYEMIQKRMLPLLGTTGGNNKIDFISLCEEFSKNRQPSTDGLADLCIEHYHDMASSTSSILYLLGKRLEATLEYALPSVFTSLYRLVAFTRTPYHEAMMRADKQQMQINAVVLTTLRLALVGIISCKWGVPIGGFLKKHFQF